MVWTPNCTSVMLKRHRRNDELRAVQCSADGVGVLKR